MLPKHQALKPRSVYSNDFRGLPLTAANLNRAISQMYNRQDSELSQARIELARLEGEARAFYRIALSPNDPYLRRANETLLAARYRVAYLEQVDRIVNPIIQPRYRGDF